jgi:hypothetical protein
MYEHGCGDSLEYFKKTLGSDGTKLFKERGHTLDKELEKIFKRVEEIANEK